MRIRCGFIGWPNPYEKLPTSSVSELEKVRTIIVVGHSGFRRSRHRRRRLHRAVAVSYTHLTLPTTPYV